MNSDRQFDAVLRASTMLKGINLRAVMPDPTPTVLLRDGSVGYCVRAPRTDDCWAAAVATTLQVPIGEVPDARIDERVAAGDDPATIDRDAGNEMERWLTARGLRLVQHDAPPFSEPRWIGVVALDGPFNDHCLVMSHNTVLFDPTVDLSLAYGGRRIQFFGVRNVTHGVTFVPTNERQRRHTDG